MDLLRVCGLPSDESYAVTRGAEAVTTLYLNPLLLSFVMNNTVVYSLSKLNEGIKGVIARNTRIVWIWAEVHSKSVNSISGHCYLDLIEKSNDNDRIIAKQSAAIWADKYSRLTQKFMAATGQDIKVGMKVQLQIQVEFHPIFGISLNILDIDPTYTLGDVFRRRLLLIEKLRKDGLFTRNKTLSIPLLPQHIAVISSSGAAGYNDFVDQLLNNKHGFAYSLTLFEAVMQGDKADKSIIEALDAINRSNIQFDLVVIIRGGGAVSDLAAFDSEPLAVACAGFLLPIVTGIGHYRDESILDMVAHSALKTPTAVAEFIISITLNAASLCDNLQTRLVDSINRRIKEENDRMTNLYRNLPYRVSNALSEHYVRIEHLKQALLSSSDWIVSMYERRLERHASDLHRYASDRLAVQNLRIAKNIINLDQATRALITRHTSQLNIIGTKIELLDPQRILSQGYSITLHNGKPLLSSSGLMPGDRITTILADGSVSSTICEKQQ